ncbi:hypothetical protein [Gimesia panareensis]|nr:hypothetical protein [Gimesia panareensis]
MTGTLDAPLQVSVIDCVEEFDDLGFVESVAEQIHVAVSEHLKQAPECFKSADLEIKLMKCTVRHFPNEIRWDLSAEITGVINDTEMQYTASSKGDEMVFREPFSNNIVSVAVSLASDVKNLVSSEYDYEKDYVHNPSHRCAKNAIFNVKQNILTALDKRVDRQPSAYSKRWKRIQTSRWFIAVFAFFVNLISLILINQFVNKWAKNQQELAQISFFSSAFMMVAAFILVHCFGYLIMPRQFFQVETAGKRALKFAGTSSIVVLKLVALTLMGLMISALIGFGYLLIYGD